MTTLSLKEKREIFRMVQEAAGRSFYSVGFDGDILVAKSEFEQPDNVKTQIVVIIAQYQCNTKFVAGKIPKSLEEIEEQ